MVLLGIGFAINFIRPPTTITVAQGDVPTVVIPNPTAAEYTRMTPTSLSATPTFDDVVPTTQTVSSLLTNLTAMQCLDNVSFEWKPCVNIQTDGENPAFLPVAARIPANSLALLVFKNNSSALSHNVILVHGGDDVAEMVDGLAAQAGEALMYIPSSTDIVASTTLLAPGSSQTVEIPALPAGTYTFICTYPAHFGGGMKGTLIVE